MAEQTQERYWLNIGSPKFGVVHVGTCAMRAGGDPEKGHFPGNWLGFYASRGAAIDAALATGRQAWEGLCCITENRVNQDGQ